jgi:hypothetical protein
MCFIFMVKHPQIRSCGVNPSLWTHCAHLVAFPVAPAGARTHHAFMSIEQITARICAFRDARDWMQFHSPKELAVAITAEAGSFCSTSSGSSRTRSSSA